MARPSLQRIWKNILLVSPNPIALAIQGVLSVVRVLPFPGWAKVCDTASTAVTQVMNARETSIRADITRIIAIENAANIKKEEYAKIKAASNAEAAKALQPHAEEKAKHEAARQITDAQTNSTKKVIQTNTEETKHVIQHATKNKVIEEHDLGKKERARDDQQHRYRLERNEILHKTAWLDNTRTHLDEMTAHINTLADKAEKTSGSAEKNTAAMNNATKEIEGLRLQVALVIEASDKLTSELNKYDTQEATGISAKEHAIQIQETMLHLMTAENKLNTEIAISSLEGKAALQQAITKDLAAREQSIDALLAKQSHETIKTLHQLTESQLESQHKIIQVATDPGLRDAGEQHLNNLRALLTKTNGITGQVEKSNEMKSPKDIQLDNDEKTRPKID